MTNEELYYAINDLQAAIEKLTEIVTMDYEYRHSRWKESTEDRAIMKQRMEDRRRLGLEPSCSIAKLEKALQQEKEDNKNMPLS